jgi:hypothetical protein
VGVFIGLGFSVLFLKTLDNILLGLVFAWIWGNPTEVQRGLFVGHERFYVIFELDDGIRHVGGSQMTALGYFDGSFLLVFRLFMLRRNYLLRRNRLTDTGLSLVQPLLLRGVLHLDLHQGHLLLFVLHHQLRTIQVIPLGPP